MRARLVPMESSDLLNDFVIDDDNIDFSTVNDNLTIMVTWGLENENNSRTTVIWDLVEVLIK